MSDEKLSEIARVVADAWDAWLTTHEVTTPTAVEEGVKAALGSWLDRNKDEIIQAIAAASQRQDWSGEPHTPSLSRREREAATGGERRRVGLRAMARALCEVDHQGATVADLVAASWLNEAEVRERIAHLLKFDGDIVEVQPGRYRSDARLNELTGDILADRVGDPLWDASARVDDELR